MEAQMARFQIKALILASLFGLTLSQPALAENNVVSAVQDDLVTIVDGEVAMNAVDMESNRGTSGVSNSMTSNQTLESATTGNSLNVGGNMTNGNVSIGENFGGFGSYVMNTGNNSSVNSAVNFNVQIMTTPQ
jgi:hypothetical protein